MNGLIVPKSAQRALCFLRKPENSYGCLSAIFIWLYFCGLYRYAIIHCVYFPHLTTPVLRPVMPLPTGICGLQGCSLCEAVLLQFPELLPLSLLRGTDQEWPCKSVTHPLEKRMEIDSLDWIKSFKSISEKKMEKFARYGIMTLTVWACRR